MQLSYAKKKNPAHEGMRLPSSYDVYVVIKDGVIRGEIKWAYRPKNAGGSAWACYLDNEHGNKTVMYNRDRTKLLPEIRQYFEGMQRRAEHEKANPPMGGTCPVASAERRALMQTFL